MKRAVESREHREQKRALADIAAGDVQDVAGEQVLQFFLAAGHSAEQQDYAGRGDHKGDADYGFLGD